jgi:hypothetical protein
MMRIFAKVSGWTRLAEHYPASEQPEGAKYTRRTVQVGAVRYRNCVTVCLSPQGLYLWARPILSKYPPVLIPWGEIQRIQETRLYWERALQLSVGNPQVATITVRMGLFKLLQPYLSRDLSTHP